MLAACLVRNFKVYENIAFIPITLGANDKLSVFTGNNGAGKSSILEAIDCFFNQRNWIITVDTKASDAYIAPLLLIKKVDFKSSLSRDLLNAISDYFWSVDESANAAISRNDSLKELLSYRDNLKSLYTTDDYYLFLIGIKDQGNSANFVTFDSGLKKRLKEKGFEDPKAENLRKEIVEFYSYIYIPIESQTKEVLRLESVEMQELMDRDILDEIEKILNHKIQVPRTALGKEKGRANVTLSPLKLINDKLDEFIDNTNKLIQKLDSSYRFSTERNQKKNLSVQDIRGRILDEYFSIRVLRKDGKLVEHLSSGEQRIALFDIAYSLLSQGKHTKKNIILAIDEPEASMHMSQCYNQFLRLSEISSRFGHQVLMTSHWYGFLPVIEHGYVNHIEKLNEVKITQHALRAVTSERRSLPDEISLKSMFDLVSSVLGMMRAGNANWLVCEGIDDQIYLTEFLKDRIDNLYILALGGIDNVVKFYNYIRIPLSEKVEVKNVRGRIVCLTDTDSRPVYPDNYKSLKNNILTIRRLQLHSNKIELIELNPNTPRHVTVIEDLLDPRIFLTACSVVANEANDKDMSGLLAQMKVSDNAKYSGFSKGIEGIEGIDLHNHKRKSELHDFLSKHEIKFKIATAYTKTLKKEDKMDNGLIKAIMDLFLIGNALNSE